MRKRLLLSLIFLVVVGLAFVAWNGFTSGMQEIGTLPADLLAAEARWKAQPVRHYRLTVSYTGFIKPGGPPGYGTCVESAEVTDEQPDSPTNQGCLNTWMHYVPRLTVTDLFGKMEQDTTTIVWGHDQVCGDLLTVAATYDATLGYPTTVSYQWKQASPNTLGPLTYLRLYGSGPRNSTCLANLPAIMMSFPNFTIKLETLS